MDSVPAGSSHEDVATTAVMPSRTVPGRITGLTASAHWTPNRTRCEFGRLQPRRADARSDPLESFVAGSAPAHQDGSRELGQPRHPQQHEGCAEQQRQSAGQLAHVGAFCIYRHRLRLPALSTPPATFCEHQADLGSADDRITVGDLCRLRPTRFAPPSLVPAGAKTGVVLRAVAITIEYRHATLALTQTRLMHAPRRSVPRMLASATHSRFATLLGSQPATRVVNGWHPRHMRPELLAGWGRTAPTIATVEQLASADAAVVTIQGATGRGVIPRGLGRSYGDAAQNGGGSVALMTSLDGIGEVDRANSQVRVQAGVSLDRLMRKIVPLGWFVPVTPGTRHVTLGGAVAADIHGKNHHRDGSFCRYVEEIDLVAPSGLMTLRPDQDNDAFWATAGGMGLTGVIAELTLRLLPIETSAMRVDTDRAADLDAVMAMMEAGDANYRYTVAWIDCLARGAHMGRAVLTRGDHATLDELSAKARRNPLRFAPRARLKAPPLVPGGLVNKLTAAAFNETWFRKAPRNRVGQLESIAAFFHPLDGVADWNRVYGPRGFLQYQFAVPFGAEDVVRHAIEAFSAAGTPSFLTVLKRFGADRKSTRLNSSHSEISRMPSSA